jgi:hypothetical protein
MKGIKEMGLVIVARCRKSRFFGPGSLLKLHPEKKY